MTIRLKLHDWKPGAVKSVTLISAMTQHSVLALPEAHAAMSDFLQRGELVLRFSSPSAAEAFRAAASECGVSVSDVDA